MDVHVIGADGIRAGSIGELPVLLKDPEKLIWVDMPICDPAAVSVLTELFDFHPMAIRACVERNRVPKVHTYSDHVFVILHASSRPASSARSTG